MKCTCKLIDYPSKETGTYVFEFQYCPLHKAASDLYEACKQGLSELYYMREIDHDPTYATATVTKLEQAIARVG